LDRANSITRGQATPVGSIAQAARRISQLSLAFWHADAQSVKRGWSPFSSAIEADDSYARLVTQEVGGPTSTISCLPGRPFALGADLPVVGACAHGPLRSMILGGVTRHMLDHADLPLLMRHSSA
jgi:nucleotide-binding universal stress UspA family protein